MPETKTISADDVRELMGAIAGEAHHVYYPRDDDGPCLAIFTPDPLRVGYAIAATFGVAYWESETNPQRADVGLALLADARVEGELAEPVVCFPGWTVVDR